MSKKNVLITGGTGSVGMTLVKEFSQSGYDVSFTYRSKHEVAMQLSRNFGAFPIEIDFSLGNDLPSYDYDILINNAGINISSDLIHEVPRSEWEQTIKINLLIPIFLANACIPYMLKKKWGRIINISSIYGLRGVEYNGPYNVSKHGLSGLTKSIAKEYGSQGITGNEICPGPIMSEMMNRIGGDEARSQGITLDQYFKQLANSIPLHRLANTEDISKVALFLSSDNAAYINGISIPVDGGLIA